MWLLAEHYIPPGAARGGSPQEAGSTAGSTVLEKIPAQLSQEGTVKMLHHSRVSMSLPGCIDLPPAHPQRPFARCLKLRVGMKSQEVVGWLVGWLVKR